MPGKIWMIIGRSSYISQMNNFDVKKIAALSFYMQVVTLGAGFAFGLFGLIVIRGFNALFSLAIVSFLLFLLFYFFDLFLFKITYRFNFKFYADPLKDIASWPKTFFLLLCCSFYWILWAIGFYFLIMGITNTEVSILAGLGFPLSSTIGIIAFFVPGGLGIREGVMGGYLTLIGHSFQSATTIAVAARLWFIIGELFIFITGLILHYRGKNSFISNFY
jgi:uncharacterized membrane protein YbhN (UPF0104 family)